MTEPVALPALARGVGVSRHTPYSALSARPKEPLSTTPHSGGCIESRPVNSEKCRVRRLQACTHHPPAFGPPAAPVARPHTRPRRCRSRTLSSDSAVASDASDHRRERGRVGTHLRGGTVHTALGFSEPKPEQPLSIRQNRPRARRDVACRFDDSRHPAVPCGSSLPERVAVSGCLRSGFRRPLVTRIRHDRSSADPRAHRDRSGCCASARSVQHPERMRDAVRVNGTGPRSTTRRSGRLNRGLVYPAVIVLAGIAAATWWTLTEDIAPDAVEPGAYEFFMVVYTGGAMAAALALCVCFEVAYRIARWRRRCAV